MDLSFSADELAFREEVRNFLKSEYPQDILEKRAKGQVLTKDDMVRGQQALAAKGWAGINWPVEHGGTGWSPTQKYIFEETAAEFDMPPLVPFGLSMVAPVIYTFGNDEQKQRFLPDILASKVWWCQGYSEPGAGSDLASLRTKAVLDGDHYIVNGQKTWTTLAQHADWIFCLVRTDNSGKKQDGISFLLIDMKSPGITVNPIVTMDGGREVNDVHFEDVRVPANNLIGEAGKGWTYAKVLLTHERTGIARVARSKKALAGIKEFASKQLSGGESLMNDEGFRRRVSEVEIELMALEITDLRTLAAISSGGAPGPESSILKIKGSEIQQSLTELAMEASGYYAMPFVPESMEPGWNGEPIGPAEAVGSASLYFNTRKTTIYGGSNEIQKNIISKAVLRL